MRHAKTIGSFLALSVVVATTLAQDSPPPNVVIIMADDLGLAELGCTGSVRIETPNIDKLRARGMLLTQAYSGSTVCAPSRCTLLTGKHTGHARVRDNQERLNLTGAPDAANTETIGAWKNPPEPNGRWGGQYELLEGTETIARALGRAGYATCCVGKWGLGGPGSTGTPNKQGFDHFYGYNCQRNAHNYYPTHLVRNDDRVTLEGNARGLTGQQYAPDLMADEMLGWVRAHADEPFFLYFATPVPHLALQVPEDSLAPYRGKWEDTPYPGGQSYLKHDEPRSAYAGMVTRFDRDVGRLMSLLEKLGVADNTFVLLTSDNGSTFDLGGYDPEFFDGTGGLRGFKTNLYEGGIRVPLIATWPGHIEAGSSDDTVVANWDFFPTVMKLTGASTTATLDGIDFSQVLLGEGDAPKREALYWEYHSRGGMQAVRMGKWKALRMKAHDHPNAPIELYDLENDPAESTNVASDNQAVVKRIKTIMGESRVPSEIQSWNFAPDERVKESDMTVLRLESGEETRQFLLRTHAVILRTGSLTLTGGGSPVNRSTVDLIGGSARLIFLAESPEDVRKEHLRKFKVNGAKAVEGQNIVIEQDAQGRTIVRAWQRSDA